MNAEFLSCFQVSVFRIGEEKTGKFELILLRIREFSFGYFIMMTE